MLIIPEKLIFKSWKRGMFVLSKCSGEAFTILTAEENYILCINTYKYIPMYVCMSISIFLIYLSIHIYIHPCHIYIRGGAGL